MPTILFSLIIPLERYDLEEYGRFHGPIFHRWLPDGEKDAISIKTKSREIEVAVWFERCGFVQDDWIRFDYKKRETDPALVERQAKLDAGPLRVKIEMKDATSNDIVTLENNVKGDENYKKIGKRLERILNENIIPFIEILRLYYGQYWLQELNNWNSKEESLGSYFRKIYAKFSIDEGATWNHFIPDEIESSVRVFSVLSRDFSAYISKEYWQDLDNVDLSEFEITLAAKLLLKAHQLKDEGDYKQAIIEGNTSLEVAMSYLFKDRLSLSKELKKQMESFWQLPLRAQLTVVSSLIEGLSAKDIENAVNIVKIRNKIVHEGYSPKNDLDTRKEIESFFTVVSKLISSKLIRFPSASTGNALFPPENK